MYRGEQLSPAKEAKVEDAGGGGVALSSSGWHGRYVFGAARGVCGLSNPSSVATPDIMRGGSESPSATSPTLGRGICEGLMRCPPLKALFGDLPPGLRFGDTTSRFTGYNLKGADPGEDHAVVGGASGLCAMPPCKERPFDDACCVILSPAALCTHGGGASGGRKCVLDNGCTIACIGGGAIGGGGTATPPLLVLCGT